MFGPNMVVKSNVLLVLGDHKTTQYIRASFKATQILTGPYSCKKKGTHFTEHGPINHTKPYKTSPNQTDMFRINQDHA